VFEYLQKTFERTHRQASSGRSPTDVASSSVVLLSMSSSSYTHEQKCFQFLCINTSFQECAYIRIHTQRESNMSHPRCLSTCVPRWLTTKHVLCPPTHLVECGLLDLVHACAPHQRLERQGRVDLHNGPRVLIIRKLGGIQVIPETRAGEVGAVTSTQKHCIFIIM
jgi:hypothetical protein